MKLKILLTMYRGPFPELHVSERDWHEVGRVDIGDNTGVDLDALAELLRDEDVMPRIEHGDVLRFLEVD